METNRSIFIANVTRQDVTRAGASERARKDAVSRRRKSIRGGEIGPKNNPRLLVAEACKSARNRGKERGEDTRFHETKVVPCAIYFSTILLLHTHTHVVVNDSIPSKGSRFRVILPRRRDNFHGCQPTS